MSRSSSSGGAEVELQDVIPSPLHLSSSSSSSSSSSIRPAFSPGDVNNHTPASQVSGSSSGSSNSRVYTIFLLLNSMIGSGVFNIPHVFSKSGLGVSYALLTFSALLVYLGLVVLVQVGEFNPELPDYAALAEHVFRSKWAARTVDFFIAIVGFGSLLSYISAISSMVRELLVSWSSPPRHHHTSTTTVHVVVALIMLIFVFPLCLQRFYGHFSFISVLSMSSVFAVLCLVVIGGPTYVATYGPGPPLSDYNTISPLSQLGSVIFTFSCASATFHTFKFMKNKTVDEWRVVCRWTVFLGWLLCVGMGTGGYLAFGASTDGIILANFKRGHVGDFFQLLFVFHLVLYIPLDFLVARHSLLRLLGLERGAFVSNAHHIVFCFTLLAIFVIVIFSLDASGMGSGDIFSTILNFTGGLGGSVISFVLPAALFLHQRLLQDCAASFDLVPCAFMFAVGSLIAVYVPVTTVLDAMR